jgi:hypothetical protein
MFEKFQESACFQIERYLELKRDATEAIIYEKNQFKNYVGNYYLLYYDFNNFVCGQYKADICSNE